MPNLNMSNLILNQMKKLNLLFCALTILSSAYSQTAITIIDEVVFYDGYATTVSEPIAPEIQRLRNDLVTTKITDAQLAQIGDELTVNVIISALCDNYDRIGSVNIAMVPKGSTTYNTATVSKIELGRFITPFMNKNIAPTSVPYLFEVNNLCRVLKSPEIVALFDFWLELEVFGVPYAANAEVAGCSGRNDVFKGQVQFVTNTPTSGFEPSTFISPLLFKADFNDYTVGASDTIGTTTKTINFTTDEDLYDATLYLITSNHGANSGGEEYIRRMHYVTVDGVQELSYKPGGKSCEPYRVFNTQANGIYGSSPRTEAEWLSFNNWCPGDTIPIRSIQFDVFTAGSHTFVISVPQAVFNGNQGNFPISLYLQGKKTGLGLEINETSKVQVFPNPARTKVSIQVKFPVELVRIYNYIGEQILQTTETELEVSKLASGMYFVHVQLKDGSTEIQHFIKN